MSKVFSKLHLFFFGEAKITTSDFLWFYGVIFLGILIGTITLIIGNIGL